LVRTVKEGRASDSLRDVRSNPWLSARKESSYAGKMEMRSGLEPEGHGVAIRYNSRSANASYESGRRPEEKGDEQVIR